MPIIVDLVVEIFPAYTSANKGYVASMWRWEVSLPNSSLQKDVLAKGTAKTRRLARRRAKSALRLIFGH